MSLKEKILDNAKKKTEATSENRRQDAEKMDKKEVPWNEKRCFNCDQRDHVSIACSTKMEGPKCFKCGKHGHIASKCVKQSKSINDTDIVTRYARKKYVKEVSINNQKRSSTPGMIFNARRSIH